jgi:Uma2 family endonuclease
MSTITRSGGRHPPGTNGIPRLEPGDHLDQETFHERYEAMPKDTRAELIGGVVYKPSPLKARHGKFHPQLITWLGNYQVATPGTEIFDNATVILGPYSEPQPDAGLIISPACGGRTQIEQVDDDEADDDGDVAGSPELIAEVASSSESYDLHSKKRDYEQAGVLEYIVLCLRQQEVVWSFCAATNLSRSRPGRTAYSAPSCTPASGSTPPRYSAATCTACSKFSSRAWRRRSTRRS